MVQSSNQIRPDLESLEESPEHHNPRWMESSTSASPQHTYPTDLGPNLQNIHPQNDISFHLNNLHKYWQFLHQPLKRVQYNKCRFEVSATSKAYTRQRKADIYGNFAEKSLNQQFEDNMTRSGHIALWESLTKCQAITFITNSSDELPWLPTDFISS